MNEKEIAKILDDNGFELKLDNLKSMLSDVELRKLAEWVDKYKTNIRKFKRMQMEYGEYITYPAALWEGDPKYKEGDRTLFVLDGAPEEANTLLEMEKEYDYFGGSLPIIEFPRGELYG